MATDWQPYAEHMLEVMSGVSGYLNLSEQNDYVPRPDSRPLTNSNYVASVWDMAFGI